jgi:hypothetical protein
VKHDYHPRGVDNQGRHPEKAAEPAPVEDNYEGEPLRDRELLQFGGIVLAALLVLVLLGWLVGNA